MLPHQEFLRLVQEGAAHLPVADLHPPAVHYLACSNALEEVRAALTKADEHITASELELQNSRLAVISGRSAVERLESILAVTAASLGLQDSVQRSAYALPYASVFQGFGSVGTLDSESSGHFSDLSPPAAGHPGTWPHAIPWTLLDFANMASRSEEFNRDGTRNSGWVPCPSELGFEEPAVTPGDGSVGPPRDDSQFSRGEGHDNHGQETVRGSGDAPLGRKPPSPPPARHKPGCGRRNHPIHGNGSRLVPGYDSSCKRERHDPAATKPKWSETPPTLDCPHIPIAKSQPSSSSGKNVKRERSESNGDAADEPPAWCARVEQPPSEPSIGTPTEVASDDAISDGKRLGKWCTVQKAGQEATKEEASASSDDR